MNLSLRSISVALLLSLAPPAGLWAQTPTPTALETPSPAETEPPPSPPAVKLEFKHNSHEIVQTGISVHVETNEVVPRVVVIQASATIDGEVEEDVVVIGGEAIINGRVRGNVVNVGAGIVLGPNARIEGNAVGVLGGIQMGTNSVVEGDAVGVIGGVRKAFGARVGGQISNVALGNWMGPDGLSLPVWLKATFTEIVLKLRLLSFHVGWVWIVAGLFLGLHALLLLAAPGAVKEVVTTLTERGATSFIMGLFALPLAALVSLILIATGIGILVIPFLWAAIFFAGLVGKAGLLQFLGAALGKGVKQDLLPLVALLVGAFLLSLLYLIPFLGLLFWMTFALWALGAALLALIGRFRKERPTAPSVTPLWSPPAPASPTEGSMTMGSTLMTMGAIPSEPMATTLNAAMPESPASKPETVPLIIAPPASPTVPDALTLPRVGFKDRFLATLLDWILLGMLIGWFDLERLRPLLILGYFVGLWVWRQTTIGGIVLRLRVARLDGRPIDIGTALVRALGALFGGLALGIGYFWSGWDPEKQGWHDKIAGTVVVKVPKTQPLI